jgi:hypothetical protein
MGDSTVFALAWFGSNQSSYGWTYEGLQALRRVLGKSTYALRKKKKAGLKTKSEWDYNLQNASRKWLFNLNSNDWKRIEIAAH